MLIYIYIYINIYIYIYRDLYIYSDPPATYYGIGGKQGAMETSMLRML